MVSTDYGEVIEVKSAEIGQSGNYTCAAKSSVGEASLVYLVDVLGKRSKIQAIHDINHVSQRQSLG